MHAAMQTSARGKMMASAHTPVLSVVQAYRARLFAADAAAASQLRARAPARARLAEWVVRWAFAARDRESILNRLSTCSSS